MAENDSLPPFIASQKLRLLDAGAGDPWPLLAPERFRAARLRQEQRGQEGPADPDEDRWKPITRRELFLRRDIRRLCLTTDAGIGKSCTLRWTQMALHEHDPKLVALYLQFGDLVDQLDELQFMPPRPGDRDQRPSLLARELIVAGNGNFTDKQVEPLVRQLIRQNRLVLLIDGLDQTHWRMPSEQQRKVREICRFLDGPARECRVIVAGRPHSLERFKEVLFGDRRWQFAQIEEFTPQEQEQYLGSDRFVRLRMLGLEVLSIPRALEAIRPLGVDDLSQLRTAGDIYFRCVETMLVNRAGLDHLGLQRDDAMRALAAMAFQMVREGNFYGVGKGDFGGFKVRMWQDRIEPSAKGTLPFDKFESHLNLLGQANQILKHGFLDHSGLEQVFWRSRPLQEFFAAMWLAKFASETDSQWMGEHPYLDVGYGLDLDVGYWLEDSTENADRYWVWRFAAEMPEGGRDSRIWVQSMKPLYAPGDGTPEGTRRSSEMIYRSWLSMEAAGKAEEVAEESGNSVVDLYRESCLQPYRAEFEGILKGKRLRVLDWLLKLLAFGFWRKRPTRVASRFSMEFRSVPPEGGSLKFACYPVTNEQYELFDPAHRKLRDKYSSENECPVISVSWYDAWSFCLWLGSLDNGWNYVLPTEEQWEFACRAGSTTEFCFGNNEGELADYAWYGANSKSKTHPVGEKKANAWGLHDMHGNVWEWCDSWYDEPGTNRVFRGGSWLNRAGGCRSASRFRYPPFCRDRYHGFRVAQVRQESVK